LNGKAAKTYNNKLNPSIHRYKVIMLYEDTNSNKKKILKDISKGYSIISTLLFKICLKETISKIIVKISKKNLIVVV